ncbi:MAG: hypothetical protein RR837_07050 [Bacteroidales bacterium]
MEKLKMNEKESLAIIAMMIQETREYIHKGVGNTQLLWGYLTVIVSLGVYFGWEYTHSQLVLWGWWVLPLIGWPTMYLMMRHQPHKVVTVIDKIIGKVWMVIGITATITPIVAFLMPSNILFIEALLISIGIAITGLILNMKVCYIPGFIGILLSFALFWVRGIDQILIFALLFTILLIIPGHIMNYMANKNQKTSLCSEN